MMVKLTPRQTNLTPRLIPSLLTDHMTPAGFPKRSLSMKGQRWKHIVVEGIGEEEKEEGVRNCEEMKHIYRGGRDQKRWERHQSNQKTCNHRPKMFSLWCRPPAKFFWCVSEYVILITHGFRITYSRKIRLWGVPKGNLGHYVW